MTMSNQDSENRDVEQHHDAHDGDGKTPGNVPSEGDKVLVVDKGNALTRGKKSSGEQCVVYTNQVGRGPSNVLGGDAEVYIPQKKICQGRGKWNLISEVETAVLSPWQEFSMATDVKIDTNDEAFNAIYDMVVEDKPKSEWRADFKYMIDRDFNKVPNCKRLMVWQNWFTDMHNNMGKMKPAVSDALVKKTLSPDQWTCAEYNVESAIHLPDFPPVAGSLDDESFIQGMKYASSQGFELGLITIPIFLNRGGEGIFLQPWRGRVSFDSLSNLKGWLDSYRYFIKHVVTLCKQNDIDLFCIQLGSEMKYLSSGHKMTDEMQFAWLDFVKEMALWCGEQYPEAKITYGGDWTEYNWLWGAFNMDDLWSHPGLTDLGLDWYEPVTTSQKIDREQYRKGFHVGEHATFEIPSSSYSDSMRYLSGTTGTSKQGLPRNKIDPAFGSKNIEGFLELYHYNKLKDSNLRDGSPVAGVRPWAGRRRREPATSRDVSGSAVIQKYAELPAEMHGMRRAPERRKCWLKNRKKNNEYAETTVGEYSEGDVDAWNVEIDVEVDEVQKDNTLGVLLDVEDTLVIEYNKNQYHLEITLAGTKIETTPKLKDGKICLRIEVDGSRATLLWRDKSSDVDLPFMPKPDSDAAVYLGCSQERDRHAFCRFFYFESELVSSPCSVGGRFHFEGKARGVRTAWEPDMKDPVACEVGTASVVGSPCEPNIFAFAKKKPPGHKTSLRNPEFFHDHSYWKGYNNLDNVNYSDLYAPINSTFNHSEVTQKVFLEVVVGAMREVGFSGMHVYNLDCRFSEALCANFMKPVYEPVGPKGQMIITHYNHNLYFFDGPQHIMNHNLNAVTTKAEACRNRL